jgi:hypothetical protein
MAKKAAIWGASLIAGVITTYLLLNFLGVPDTRYGFFFFLATALLFMLLFMIPIDHFTKAGIVGNPTPKKQPAAPTAPTAKTK